MRQRWWRLYAHEGRYLLSESYSRYPLITNWRCTVEDGRVRVLGRDGKLMFDTTQANADFIARMHEAEGR